MRRAARSIHLLTSQLICNDLTRISIQPNTNTCTRISGTILRTVLLLIHSERINRFTYQTNIHLIFIWFLYFLQKRMLHSVPIWKSTCAWLSTPLVAYSCYTNNFQMKTPNQNHSHMHMYTYIVIRVSLSRIILSAIEFFVHRNSTESLPERTRTIYQLCWRGFLCDIAFRHCMCVSEHAVCGAPQTTESIYGWDKDDLLGPVRVECVCVCSSSNTMAAGKHVAWVAPCTQTHTHTHAHSTDTPATAEICKLIYTRVCNLSLATRCDLSLPGLDFAGQTNKQTNHEDSVHCVCVFGFLNNWDTVTLHIYFGWSDRFIANTTI